MKLAAKILFSIFIITGAGFYYLTHGILENVRTRYLEGVEETLVDQSRILSSYVADEIRQGRFSTGALHSIFDTIYRQQFNSTIYQLHKTAVDLRVYITDEKGLILFDSTRKALAGEDYSHWRDVYLTLQGKYGARSSRENVSKQSSSVLYVAAPILIDGNITGVLTVAKPTTNINSFLSRARAKIKIRTIIAAGFISLLSIMVILYLTRPVKLLTRYATDIKNGQNAVLPRLDNSEIGDMGRAFEDMRQALENRKYVEHYVQTLTHEIKSPLSAIKGAAELLEENMSNEQKTKFLRNIRSESERIKMLVDRMLELSSIENMNVLNEIKELRFSELTDEVLEWHTPVLQKKNLILKTDIDTTIVINADAFLIKQALSNLIQNSIDFSLPEQTISITATLRDNTLIFEVHDQGPGIPAYASTKIFNKFFSLQRPDNGKKSTGLGLNFVKEITTLHNGTITLENNQGKGACARLTMPAAKKDLL